MKVFIVLLGTLLALLPSGLAAEDVVPISPPNPPPALSIEVSKDVTGTGKRADPYTFDSSSRCVLMLSAPDAVWDLSDAPPDALILPGGGAVVFSLSTSGEYLVTARWKDGYSKIWLTCKSGPSPPKPEPIETASNRVAKALQGGETKRDAVALIAASEVILDKLPTFKDGQDLQTAWGALLAANKWVKGSRPKITSMIEAEIPAGPATPFSDMDRKRIARLFQAILDGSQSAIASGGAK